MEQKLLLWVGSCKDDLMEFPEEIRRDMGYALYLAQLGEKHPRVAVLKGFGGAGVLEIIEDHDSGTYRAVYTIKMAHVVFVLHAFQKKSKKGIETSKQEIELIKRRLKDAQELYKELGNF